MKKKMSANIESKDLPLKERIIKAFPLMKDDDFDRHETDLYVRSSPMLLSWLKENYEFFCNVSTFINQVEKDT